MCLYTTQVKPKVFTKDRVFYKVLYKRIDEYCTPYIEDSVQIGKAIRAKGKGKLIRNHIIGPVKTNAIYTGYIHLLRKKSDAEKLKFWMETFMLPCEKLPVDEVVIVHAKVKSGTKYYSGIDCNNYGSVAVKKVKYELI